VLSFIFGVALFTAVMNYRLLELEKIDSAGCRAPCSIILDVLLFSRIGVAGITAKRLTESVNLCSRAKTGFVLALQCNRWNDTGEIVPLIRPVPVRRRRRQYSARLSLVA